jgi:hypothetical protein
VGERNNFCIQKDRAFSFERLSFEGSKVGLGGTPLRGRDHTTNVSHAPVSDSTHVHVHVGFSLQVSTTPIKLRCQPSNHWNGILSISRNGEVSG